MADSKQVEAETGGAKRGANAHEFMYYVRWVNAVCACVCKLKCGRADTLMHEGVTPMTLKDNGLSEDDAITLGYCVNHIPTHAWPNGELQNLMRQQASATRMHRVKDLGAQSR